MEKFVKLPRTKVAKFSPDEISTTVVRVPEHLENLSKSKEAILVCDTDTRVKVKKKWDYPKRR